MRGSANTVVVVGMGMSAEDLGSRAHSVINNADILIGGKRHLDHFSELPAHKVPISRNLQEVLRIIKTSMKKKRVVVLASGDPGYYGIARSLIAHLGKESVEIIPNITTFQAAFARIKESWDDALLLSLHGRALPPLATCITRYRKVGILTDRRNTPRRIAQRVLSDDPSLKDSTVFVLERLGTAEEEVHKYRLKDIIDKSFSSLNAMVLMASPQRGEREGDAIRLGIPDDLFSHRRGLITKDDIRTLTLAKLNLPTRGVFWDVGSGSGSVAVEAALLSPGLSIFAVEKNEKHLKDIRRNIRRFQVGSVVTPIWGEAPVILRVLPKPHRVFIGGTEGKLLPILRYCKHSLLPSGKIVINAATLETVHSALSFFDKVRWYSIVTLVNIARMKKVADQRRFQPLNPVFIVEGARS